MRRRNESGQLSVFVTALALPLVLVAGLVADGGGILAARQQAVASAFEAARAGAQAIDIDVLRSSGVVTVDPSEAREQALAYLAASGEAGTVAVQGENVTVRVTLQHHLALLSLLGLGPVAVTGVATATAVQGVTEANQ